jgi:plastocyanin
MKKSSILAVGLLAAIALVAGACGKKPTAQKEAAPAPTAEEKAAEAPVAPAAGAGSIKGKINFTGTAPVAADLNRQSDPFCAQTKMKAQDIIVNANNTLKNVAVRVIGATGGEPAGAKVEVDQKNCMYEPRVLVGWPDQDVTIVNSDPTLHNVHTYAFIGNKTLFNQAQPKGAPPIIKQFSKDDGEIIKFKCDVHPWMTGWMILSDNGFSAVTGETGEFEIKGVPVGTYTLKTFHEQYGEKTQQVTVEADKEAVVDLSYDGTEKAAFKYREVHIGLNEGAHEHH